VDRFLGDGLLALFGMPQAHEDDPERAMRAAIEIQEAAARLRHPVKVGINTGEVYVGTIGSERHQEVSVAGPVVSLASWLQGQAEPGQILVGKGTYRQSRCAFELSPLSLAIQGMAEPVTAYAVARALPRPEKTRGIEGLRAELIGRDEELAKLKAAAAAVIQGHGRFVSLIGEAGVGKSRLVAELRQAVQDWGWGGGTDGTHELAPDTQPLSPAPFWLEGRCLELNTTAGYSVFVDLFRGYFAWQPEEDDRARGERLAASLRAFGDCGELAADRVEEMGPVLGNLLSAGFDTDWDERLLNASPEQIRHQTFLAVRDFLVALSRGQPLLLILEDLHWADSLSLNLISLLMESLQCAPIGLLCVYRPEREATRSADGGTSREVGRWSGAPPRGCADLAAIAGRKCPERIAEIGLRELTPEQSGQLVESLLPDERLPGPVKKQIMERSRGNPFFLEELVRSLIDSRLVYREGDRWRVQEGVETVSVPESVQSLILSRFDRLRPDLKQVLQSAAVIGRVFRPRLLARVVARGVGPEPAHRLATALWELADQGLVYEERAVPEAEFSFKHVLMQETIYQRILRRHRAGLHQLVAEAIEALYRDGLLDHLEELAYHYERSAAGEKAVEYLLKAGEKARRAYLNEDAIGYFQRALDRLDDCGLRIADIGGSNPKSKIQNGAWVWHDPFGDCSLTVRNGLEIRAANGRDLCYPNRSAPRLLRPTGARGAGGGDFAIQAFCRTVSAAGEPRLGGEADSGRGAASGASARGAQRRRGGPGPAIGGLLLWRNKEQYLRLDWGARGTHQVSLGGCLPGKQIATRMWPGEKDIIIGRGRLVTDGIFLRLERLGGWVRALCSGDGRHWFLVGQTTFPGEGALEVGLHAIGKIDRMIYPGAHPEGTAIRFESFELWV
jgi:adenylate cyclase